MTGKRIRRTLSFTASLGLCVALGCGSADDAPPPTAAAPPPPASPAPAEDAPNAETPRRADPDPPEAKKAAKYTPPFPNRRNPFAPVQTRSVARNDNRDSGDSVVLKGFANVGEPVAVLAINGEVSPMAVGSERYGVQVISIEPPKVILHRERERWTVSLQ